MNSRNPSMEATSGPRKKKKVKKQKALDLDDTSGGNLHSGKDTKLVQWPTNSPFSFLLLLLLLFLLLCVLLPLVQPTSCACIPTSIVSVCICFILLHNQVKKFVLSA